ncbi:MULTISPECIES: PFL family protein [Coriobacteriia]|uniref:PFL family protein n=1 Tax=Coriobacteriia TaxID=84998 RepID=UPI000E47A930|nr:MULTISPECIES: PFL family protein [Coriobacteriia]MBL6463605.1 PFL family protein [Senegalimassilia sp.]RHO41665.1 PFL family protein [Eggerthella sp. AM16-19]
MQITPEEIAETLAMVSKQHLDIRTITLGLNLRSCTDSDINTMARKVYDKMTKAAEQLVPTAEQLEREFGIPIVNKRISVTPIAEICAAVPDTDLSRIAVAMDKAGAEVGVDFVGGFSALVHKGASAADNKLMDSIPNALAATERVCSSVNVGSTRAGINMDAALKMAGIVKQCAELTADRDCIAAGKLVVFCNAVEDNPFMAGAFHGSGEADAVVNVGVSGPGVVRQVLANMPKDADMTEVAEAIKATAFKITRAGELMAREASRRMGVAKGILDLSLAPTPAEGDSVAEILEAIGVGQCGGPGTTAALAMLNDAVKKGGVMASSSVGGLSGAFIPVSEDAGMIRAAESGALCLEKLEAMTCVCSVGLDMIAIPGDTPVEAIFGIIADECAIGMINNKTTAVRVIPAIGKKVGDKLDFGGLLGYAPIMPVNTHAGTVFAHRGGRMPAPINSLKN